MERVFIGGLYVPYRIKTGIPWIRLSASENSLDFQLRFGLGKLFGPWTLPKSEVAKVYRQRWKFDPWPCLGIMATNGETWSYRTYSPEEVLAGLEDLGYPIDQEYHD